MHPSHFTTSEKLLQAYHGEQPFHLYLKNYFSKNKKHGSRDRKEIAAACYDFFRKKIFPYPEELSAGIDREKFIQSFRVQPKLFVRIRPGKENKVKAKLKTAGIIYETISANCLAFINATKLEEVLEIDKEVVIQDASSQRTGELMRHAGKNNSNPLSIWDCCAGSGGKSILASDMLQNIDLTVTDKREIIIENLRKRFRRAGIQKYHSSVIDVSQAGSQPDDSGFDLIIADVPCTGSGTWSRTPERLSYFKKKEIEKYSEMQKSILSNVIPALKPGGYLLYITCSVFRKENEDVVDFIKEKSMDLVEMRLLKGYEMGADTIFAALFRLTHPLPLSPPSAHRGGTK